MNMSEGKKVMCFVMGATLNFDTITLTVDMDRDDKDAQEMFRDMLDSEKNVRCWWLEMECIDETT
jgi:hypothetical protein